MRTSWLVLLFIWPAGCLAPAPVACAPLPDVASMVDAADAAVVLGGEASGRLVDLSGEPLACVRVHVEVSSPDDPEADTGELLAWMAATQVQTDGAGRFTIGVPDGPFHLLPSGPGIVAAPWGPLEGPGDAGTHAVATMDGVMVTAHRGGGDAAPENTLAAVHRAALAGVHRVELDVRPGSNGSLVVLHDPTVGRTTDGHGLVDRMPAEERDALDAGSWFHPSFSGQRIPVFSVALAVVHGHGLGLEGEAKGMNETGVGVWLARWSAQGIAAKDVMISIDPRDVLDCLELEMIRCGWVAPPGAVLVEHFAEELGSSGMDRHVPLFGLDRDDVDALHARGIAVTSYTVDDPEDVVAAYETGLDHIMTNDPRTAFLALDGHLRGAMDG